MLSTCCSAPAWNDIQEYVGMENLAICSACKEWSDFEELVDIQRIKRLLRKVDKQIKGE